MNKPLYLIPFIFVYKIVSFLLKLIISIPKHAAIGFFFTNIVIISMLVNGIHKFLSLVLNGFIYLSFIVYKIVVMPSLLISRILPEKKPKQKKIKPVKEKKKTSIEEIKSEELVKISDTSNSENVMTEPLAPIDNDIKEEPISFENLSIEEEIIEPKVSETVIEPIVETKPEKVKKIKEKKIRKPFNETFIYKTITLPYRLVRNIFLGFVVLSFIVYKFIKYVVMGVIFPFHLVFGYLFALYYRVYNSLSRFFVKTSNKKKLKQRLEKEEKRQKILNEKRKKAAAKLAATEKKNEESVRKKLEDDAKRKRSEKDEYINDKVTIEKKTMGDHINDFLESLIKYPKGLKEKIALKFKNLSLIKNRMNQEAITKEALLINFDSEDAVKSDVKILYEYVGKDADGKVVKGHFEAFSKVEVHSFLLSEGYEVYSIRTNKWIQAIYGRRGTNKVKIKTKDLIFFLTQLSTYIKAGIPLVESLKILSRQFKNKSYQRIFKTMIYDLTMGDNFSDTLEKQGLAFPRLLINMVKAAEMTGELPESLDNMSEYYTETEKTRKQMVTAMIYPSIVFIMSMGVITFIIMFVIPKFVDIYNNMDAATIPGFTLFVISLSEFLEKNILWVLLGFAAFLLIIHYMYKNVKILRTLMQWLAMRTPVLGNIIVYNEVTIFTKTFSSLLSHNVFITDSMEVLNRITNNEIYKMIILDTINNLAKGDKISKSFANNWAFPLPAYEMLVTGEKTGQLPEMMAKVADYYQELHKQSVTRFKTLIEPALIVFLTFVVGGIILAVIIPMFSMFTMIQQ